MHQFKQWPREKVISYFAGFFDGEGCVYMAKNKRMFEVTVAQTDEGVIKAFCAFFGVGQVTSVKFSNVKWKERFNCRVRRLEDVVKILEELIPHLVLKRSKAEEVLKIALAVKAEGDAISERYARIAAAIKREDKYADIAAREGVSYAYVNSTAFCMREGIPFGKGRRNERPGRKRKTTNSCTSEFHIKNPTTGVKQSYKVVGSGNS